ncbi:MAG: YggS family pyridoxal phosphate-dependent enzyme [Candidatus Omnitrophota bacterium]
MIKDNLGSVCERIKQAALRSGRRAEDIVLVCVVKEADTEDVREAAANGVTDIGENTVQATLSKYESLGDAVNLRWHFIGHLQTNKAKSAVKVFDLIHSVDSVYLAEEIQKEARKINKVHSILLQVNVSGEEAKYGIRPEAVKDILFAISGMKNIALKGLMTIAPYSEDAESSRRYFKQLRGLRDALAGFNSENISLKHLSMGMSGDFEVAIEEGADIVRIGSAIFNKAPRTL